jgi:hypothetical protein
MSTNNRKFIPVPSWNDHHEWPRHGGLRHLIFNRKTNGLDQFGVIKKVGKRVLIDEAAFFAWIEGQQGGNGHEV